MFFFLQTIGSAHLSVRITGCPSSVSDRSVDPSSRFRPVLPVPDPVAAELFSGVLEQPGAHRVGLKEEDDDARRELAIGVSLGIGQSWAELGRIGPNWAELGRTWF